MKKIVLTALSLLTLLFVNCDKNADDPKEPTVELNNEINDFVWKGMNKHYYWQEDIANLADTKNDVQNDYNTYLNGYNDPEALFESLLFDKGNTDRDSRFIEDYRASDASSRGVNDAFGFEFDVVIINAEDDIAGYVTYVVPNSPASDANMKRGDIFNVFNGVTLNLDNYRIVNKYYSDNTISMKFATAQNGNLVSNGKEVSLTIRELTENPVHYSSVLNVGGKKVGYLVYNGFKYTFHNELNDIFGTFKSEGIQELVLDLRYNGGGSVLTSAYLSSMIHATPTSNEIFAKLIYNSKNSSENAAYPFFNEANIYNFDGEKTGSVTLNRLSTLSRIYVITSGGTASASEMVINGLRAYMGDSNVILVGTTTYGKNVGSFTIYDSPDFTSKNINSAHTNAIQPITFKIFNKLDQSDYTLGFDPNIEVKEWNYWDNILPFGDTNEVLLKTALDNISGAVSRSSEIKEPQLKSKKVFNSADKRQFSKEMYIIPQEMD